MEHTYLKHFICSFCHEFYKPPIVQCLTGHTSCINCARSSGECPHCTATYGYNIRNFALEFLLADAKFKCKNENCTSILTVDDYYKHLSVCEYTEQECKICGNRVTLTNMSDHITSMHTNKFIINNNTYTLNEIENCFVEVDNYIFWLKSNMDSIVTFMAQSVNLIEFEKFKLTVKVIKDEECHVLGQLCSTNPICHDETFLKTKTVWGISKNKEKEYTFIISIEQINPNTSL